MKMTKEELKKKLMDAKLDEAAVDAKLASISDEQLKELDLDDVPEATLLKELELEVPEPAPAAAEEQKDTQELEEVDQDELLKSIGDVVEKRMKAVLADLEIDLPELKEMGATLAATPEFKALAEQVARIEKLLTSTSTEVIKEQMKDMPRQGKLRIVRYKTSQPPADDEEEVDENGNPIKPKKQTKEEPEPSEENPIAIGTDGKVHKSMSGFMGYGD